MWNQRRTEKRNKHWKIGLIFFLFPILSNAGEPTERLEYLTCEVPFKIKTGFEYPIKLNQFSKFQIGKKIRQDIFQLNFSIDSEFRFPKDNNQVRFVPHFSGYETLKCFTDKLPETLSYLYEDAKNNNPNVSIYFSKEKEGFVSNIFIKE